MGWLWAAINAVPIRIYCPCVHSMVRHLLLFISGSPALFATHAWSAWIWQSVPHRIAIIDPAQTQTRGLLFRIHIVVCDHYVHAHSHDMENAYRIQSIYKFEAGYRPCGLAGLKDHLLSFAADPSFS